MRRIDELLLTHRFYGARRMVFRLRREGVRIGRRRAARLMRLMGVRRSGGRRGPARRSRGVGFTRICYEAWFTTRLGGRAAEPCLVRRYYRHPGEARLPLPGGDRGLGERPCAGLAAVEHAGHGASVQMRSKRPWSGMAQRRCSTSTRAASSPASPISEEGQLIKVLCGGHAWQGNYVPGTIPRLHSPPACGVVARCHARRLEGRRDGVQHSGGDGEDSPEVSTRDTWVDGTADSRYGLECVARCPGFAPGMFQDNAMTMDTAGLVLVNSTLQSTKRGLPRGLFRMRRASG